MRFLNSSVTLTDNTRMAGTFFSLPILSARPSKALQRLSEPRACTCTQGTAEGNKLVLEAASIGKRRPIDLILSVTVVSGVPNLLPALLNPALPPTLLSLLSTLQKKKKKRLLLKTNIAPIAPSSRTIMHAHMPCCMHGRVSSLTAETADVCLICEPVFLHR